MRKAIILFLILPVFISCSMMDMFNNTTDEGTDGRFYYVLRDDEESYAVVDLAGDLEKGGEITVPSKYRGKPVTEIRRIGGWIGKVTLPDTVTEISDNAFANCSELVEVVFSSGVKTIGDNAFVNCDSLQKFTLPASCESIGNSAFYDCRSLQYVDLVNVKDLGTNVFSGCTSLESVKLSENMTYIPESAFHLCSGLKEVVIPENVREIGTLAFYSTGIESVIVKGDLDVIGSQAFYECRNLVSFQTEHSIREIGPGAFGYASSLSDISSLKGVELIGKEAFRYCRKITDLEINGNSIVFDDLCFRDSLLGKLTINCNIAHIGSYVFANTGITEIEINGNIAAQEGSLDFYSDNLNKLTIHGNVGYNDGFRLNILNTLEIYGNVEFLNLQNTKLESVYVKGHVERIGSFQSSARLRSLEIESANGELDGRAFYYCGSLENIEIPDGITDIDDSVFGYCNSLETITISSSVENCGNLGFSSCDNVRKIIVHWPGGVKPDGWVDYWYAGVDYEVISV